MAAMVWKLREIDRSVKREVSDEDDFNRRCCTTWPPMDYVGFEHSVVNVFLITTGILLGAKVTIADWWLWNQIPVTIGDLLGGWLLIGLPMHLTYVKRSAAGGPRAEIRHDGQVAEFVSSKR